MSNIIIGFGGFDYEVVFDLLFAIITLFVSINAFKIYKLSDNKNSLYFGIGFLSLSVSYVIESIINFLIISRVNENICTALKLNSVGQFNLLGMYVHMFFFLLAMIILTYMTMKDKDIKTFFLLLLITVISLIFSTNKIILFYLIASLFLVYLVIHYYRNYLKHKMKKTLLVLFAFVFLLFSHIHFLFSVNHALLYSIGHFFELFAYLFILINLLIIIKNGKKR